MEMLGPFLYCIGVPSQFYCMLVGQQPLPFGVLLSVLLIVLLYFKRNSLFNEAMLNDVDVAKLSNIRCKGTRETPLFTSAAHAVSSLELVDSRTVMARMKVSVEVGRI